MKQFICYILLLMLTGYTTAAQVNPWFKKPRPAYTFASDKQGLVKKDATLYPPPRFSFYAYPLPAIEPYQLSPATRKKNTPYTKCNLTSIRVCF
jgi:hypothetical protein